MRSIVIFFRLLVIGVASSAFVVVLFIFSESEVHRNNAFVRRYPHHPIIKKFDLPIKYNSYYIAGYENEMLYLGNTAAPLHLLKVNLKTKDTSHIRIKLDKTDLPFRSVEVNLQPPYFFVMDGSIPFIFRGRIGDWKAHLWMKDKAYFSKAIAIDSNKIYISTVSGKTQMTTIGLIEKEDEDDFNVILNTNILEKQIDGIFDVDGIMAVSPNHKELGYIYFYRNQFMLMDSKLKLLKRQRTIDTVQKAQIKLSETNNKGEIKMEAPPLIVNKMATIYNDLLLINSNRLGKYEDKDMLKEASIIDVYNWKKESYEFSFYLYHIGNERAKEFSLYKGHLIALIDDKLVIYELVKQHFSSDLSFKYSQKINQEGSYRK